MISEILPRAKYPNYNPVDLKTINKIVNSVNDVLRKVVDRLHCLGHHDFFHEDGSLMRELLSRDGLHLSLAGTEILTDKLVKKIVALECDIQKSSYTNNSEMEIATENEITCGPLYSDKVKHVSAAKSDSPFPLTTSAPVAVKPREAANVQDRPSNSNKTHVIQHKYKQHKYNNLAKGDI